MALLPGFWTVRPSHLPIPLLADSSRRGAYFGQAAHFKMFAPEKIPYGITRCADLARKPCEAKLTRVFFPDTNEVARVWEVMEGVLSKRDFLVGGKVTIVDLSFIPCTSPLPLRTSILPADEDAGNNIALHMLLPEGVDAKTAYPSVWAWHHKLIELSYVAEGLAEQKAAMSA